jgi:2,3-bisphosphoglycerate-independent phosphoglycerate mutase
MDSQELIKPLLIENETKLILLVMDGLGGIPDPVLRKTELETAATPNLDGITSHGICGLADIVAPGITPGSGPGHLALFGYDPLKYVIGRGVLEALGMDLELTPDDVAVRGNYATMDARGIITDRRAGRIATERNVELCKLLRSAIQEISGVRVLITPGKEHRFVILFRGKGLSGDLNDTDPQKEGLPLKPPQGTTPESKRTAEVVSEFIRQANEVLKSQHPANSVLLRGFAKHPEIPSMKEAYGLKACAIATYPMYRGLAQLMGMEVLRTGETVEDEFKTLVENYKKYDFFFLHVKKTDSYGEDGNFRKKVEVILEVDAQVPKLVALDPDVLVVTGDHSTPAVLKSHSWHPVPYLLWAKTCIPDEVSEFSERSCAKGMLGRFPAVEGMRLMLAHAQRLAKFGA